MSGLGAFGIPTPNHAHHRYQQKGDNVDDLNQRVDCRAGRVLVGVAHGIAGDRGFVCIGALAAVVALFDILFRIVPGAAAGTHRNRDEKAGDDGAHQDATECRGP